MRYLSLLVVLLLLTGCPTDDPAPTQDPAVQNDMRGFDDDVDDDLVFSATLQGQPGYEGVSGSATAHVMDGQTHIEASLSGGQPGATHPWHVHEGTCGAGGGIVGQAAAYPAFETGDDGAASAEATINVELRRGADYHVNVHGAPGDLGTIVACGNLTAN